MTPQWNADIITPEEKGSGTKVIGDNQQVQTTLESGENITIEDGKISATGDLENVQADWTQSDSEDPSYIKHKPNLATVATSGDYGDLSNRPDLSVYATTSELADKADKVTGAVNGNLAGFDSNGNLADSGVAAANLVHDASYVHTDNNFSNSDVTKLSGIEAGAEVNVQSSWTETDTSSDAYIVGKPDLSIYAQSANLATVATSGSYDDLTNKPTIPAAVTVDQTYNASSTNAQSGTAVAGAIANKQDTIADLSTIRSNALLGSTAVQPGDLATVATTGAYSDLSGTPTIPSGDQLVPSATSADNGKVLTVDNNGDPSWVTPSAGTVYTAGDGIDITNSVISADVDGSTIGIDSSTKKIKLLSTIPTVDQTYNASSANAQSGVAVAGAISTKQDTISDLATIRSGAAAGATAVQPSSLATVATTGDYADLQNKPSIPAAQVNSDWNAASGVAQILNKPNLATVATTGDYDDLLNKPSIPAAVTVDQTYSASSTNPQSGTAVAEAVAAISVDEVPAVTSSDDGKILKATYSGGTGSYDWESPPTEKNLVAGSNVSITSSGDNVTISATDTTYTFSTGLTNSSGTVTVTNPLPASSSSDEDKVLTVNSSGEPVWAASQGGGNEVPSVTSNDDGKILKASYSGGTGSYSWQADAKKPVVAGTGISITNNTNDVTIAATTPVPAVTSSDDAKVLKATYSGGVGSYAWAAASGGTTYTAGDGIDITNDTISADVDGTTIGIDSSTKKIKLLSAIPTVDQTYSAASTNAQSGVAVAGALATVNQVPSSTSSDSTKVLTVDSSGAPVWAAAQGGTTYTAGDGIDISNDTISADVDGTTIGIDSSTKKIKLLSQIPVVDQTYSASSTNAQSGTAVAGALATVNQVPASTSSDSTKVLTVDSSGAPVWAAAQGGTTYSAGDGIAISNDTIAADVDGSTIGIDSTTKKIKLLSQIPVVDQTYSASSTNAQSGTAVASAIAAVPTKPIVAGSNITITENTNDITLAATMPTVDQTYSAVSTNAQSGVAVASAISTAIGPIETALSNL